MSYIVGSEAMDVALGKLDMRVVDGVGKLFFEIAKGTTGLLHSRGAELLGLVVKYTSAPPVKENNRSAEATVEALGIISFSLCAEHARPGKGSLIVDIVSLELNKQLKAFSSCVVAYQSKPTRETALAVTNTCSALSRLSHMLLVVLDKQDALILRSSPTVEDQLRSIVSMLAALV